MKLTYLLAGISLLFLGCLTPTLAAEPIVTIKTELSSPIILENTQDKNYLKISLTGIKQENEKRSPINLALVIDRSSSMHGDRIEKAREAAIMAVNLLTENDTLSIVAYDNSAEIILPAQKIKNKPDIIKTINEKVTARGMTALFAGVSKGLSQVNKKLNRETINRIILLSDGQANVGPTSISELAELSRHAAKKGIAITTIGLGNGYNEDLMTAIAGYSDGNHMFVDNSSDLEMAFSREFNDVMSIVAQDVTVTISVDKNAKPVRLLGRDGEINGNTVQVKLNQLYSNQEKYVLLEVIPPTGQAEQNKPLATVVINYDNLLTKKQDSYKDDIAISYTKSTEVVQQAIVEEVVADTVIQKTALANEEAIKLMDQGRSAEAKAVVQQNVATLSGMQVASPKAAEKIRSSLDMNQQLSEELETKDASSSRKSLKEKAYATQKQQK